MTEQTQDAATVAFAKLAEVAANRAGFYHQLIAGFMDPTPDFVDRLLSGEFNNHLKGEVDWLGSDEKVFEVPFAALDHFLEENKDREASELLQELKIEHARLFIGPPTALISPFETSHRNNGDDLTEKPLLLGPLAQEIENLYADAGLKLSADLREPPDHITTELEFLYYLCTKEAEAWEEGNNNAAKKWRRRQLAFVQDHLAKWAIQFFRQVADETQHSFYVALASIGATFMQVEEGFFKPA